MSNALVRAGDTLLFPLTFGIQVFVDTAGGKPYLGLEIDGANPRRAYFKDIKTSSEGVSGGSACSVIFAYSVLPTDPDGVISTASLNMNGAYIQSYSGQDISELNIPFGATEYEVSQAGTNLSHDLQGLNLGENVAFSGFSTPASSTLTMRSGVGDGDDLKVEIVADHVGRWVPKVHSGFFYYKGEECYLFGRKATTTASNVTSYRPGSDCISIYLNPNSEDVGYDNTLITHYGPIFVKEILDTGYKAFTHVTSPMRANIQTTISALDALHGTGLYRVRVEGIPTEVRRAADYTAMRRAWILEGVTSPEDYYVEMEFIPSENGLSDIVRYYLLVTGDDALFVTYAVTDIVEDVGTPPDPFIQYEVCRIDNNMQIRTMYRDVISPASKSSSLAPSVTFINNLTKLTIPIIPQGDLAVENTGTISGNLITLSSTYTALVNSTLETFTLKPGDEVAVSYYVDNSFTVDDLSTGGIGIKIMSSRPTVPNIQVEYEGAPDGWWRGHALKATDSSYTQFNPLKDGLTPGFLYIEDITESSTEVKTLEITSDVAGPLLCKIADGTSDTARVKIKLTDNYQNPIAYVPISLGVTGGIFTNIYPITSNSDWKGELSCAVQASTSGTITVSASTSGASGSLEFIYYDRDEYLTGSFALTGALGYKVILTRTEVSEYVGTVRVMARVSDISGAYPVSNAQVIFHSTLGRFNTVGAITSDDNGVATAHYYPIIGDEIYATFGYVQSNSIIIESTLNVN